MALEDDVTEEVERRNALQRAIIDRVAREAADNAGREAGRRAARAYLLFFVVMLFGATVYQYANDRRTCERVNTLRVREANRTAQVMWGALSASRDRSVDIRSKATYGSKEYNEADRAVREIDKYADAMTWTPKTDCAAAASPLPNHYRAPEPRRFTKKHRDLKVIPQ